MLTVKIVLALIIIFIGVALTMKTGFEGMKEKILEASKKEFKPEFLNRLDDMVVFKMLEKDSLSSIVDLEVKKLLVRLKEKDI